MFEKITTGQVKRVQLVLIPGMYRKQGKSIGRKTSYHDVFHNRAGRALPVAGNVQPEFGILNKVPNADEK